MKKYSALVVAMIIMTVSLLSPVSAYADESIESALSSGVMMDSDSFMANYGTEIKASKIFNCKGKKYYGNGKELYISLRDKIDRMESGFTVNYFSKTQMHPNTVFGISSWKNNTLNEVYDLFMGATDQRLSVTCTDGDYSRFNVTSIGVKNFEIVNNENGKYCYSFKFVIDYRYSKNQEKAVTDKVNEIVGNVRQWGLSDYDALLYIHDYICDSTTYDNYAVRYPSEVPASFSAYGALVGGKCVCQGYALAFYRICKVLGYDVRFVASDPDRGKHAWNLVGVDGRYYFVDLTWDDSAKDGSRDGDCYDYFLVNYEDLRSDDWSSYAHLIYDELYDDAYFNNRYKKNFAQTSYNKEAYPLLSSAKITLSSTDFKYTGNQICPQAYVYDSYGNVLTENIDYTVSYSDNVKCGIGRAVINGLGAYSGMTSSRSFNINPTSTKLKVSTADSNSFTVSWKDDGASGYTVQIYKDGRWKTVGTAYSNSYKVKGLSAYKEYKVRVRPYEDINRVKTYGSYSSVLTACTAPQKASLSSVSRAGKAFTARWKRVSCDGYEIQYATAKSMKGAKSVKVKKAATLSKKVSGLSSGKKYYVRVRSYKKLKGSDGKTNYYYSDWSSKKLI